MKHRPTSLSSNISILHLDDHVLAADKPTGLLSVPGRTPDKQDCLWRALREDFSDLRVVHRLDRDTSGVMLFARTAVAQSYLSRMFAVREIEKEYVAVVTGVVEGKSGRIELCLRRDMSQSLPPKYVVDREHGKHAVTDWTVTQRLPARTRIKLYPRTGRSHQLRAHCQAMGHAIVGDPIYGTETGPRMLLHAHRVSFSHPVHCVNLEIVSASPF